MKCHRFHFLNILGIALTGVLFSCKSSLKEDNHQPWSVRMADSVMKRSPDPWTLDFKKDPRWEYTYGLMLKAILEVGKEARDEKYFQYAKAYYDHFIDKEGNILTYKLDEYNIDRINSGKPLFQLFMKTGDDKYKKAIELLRRQMKTHLRTSEGGFWHKKIYPHQMWLDGLYMAAPFLAEYAMSFHEPGIFDDIVNQLVLMEKHAREEKTGLLYHGWDERRKQRWSDPETGVSPNFWGRAMGWYSMALVDVLDFLPENHPGREDVIAIFNRLATAITHVQDRETGLWYQVLDQGTRKGNYLESSASCMFVCALGKGVRKGYIHPAFLNIARKGYAGILKHFIAEDKKGLVNIDQVCAVAGLGGSPYRDGSYEYYIHEKIGTNDPKAVGPFILASLEIEMIGKQLKLIP